MKNWLQNMPVGWRSDQHQLEGLESTQQQLGSLRSDHQHLEGLKSEQQHLQSLSSDQWQSGDQRSDQPKPGGHEIGHPPVGLKEELQDWPDCQKSDRQKPEVREADQTESRRPEQNKKSEGRRPGSKTSEKRRSSLKGSEASRPTPAPKRDKPLEGWWRSEKLEGMNSPASEQRDRARSDPPPPVLQPESDWQADPTPLQAANDAYMKVEHLEPVMTVPLPDLNDSVDSYDQDEVCPCFDRRQILTEPSIS